MTVPADHAAALTAATARLRTAMRTAGGQSSRRAAWPVQPSASAMASASCANPLVRFVIRLTYLALRLLLS